MAKKSRPTFQKRERERARIQKQKDKETRRLETIERKAAVTTAIEGEDPDIAGVRPGPQPLPEQWDHADNSG
ncbi:MAG TPA: hypothetical protein VFD58_32910 [Blastocatellia bacterium]|nr:hypothetical protein [Blastocatellia bacterium]